VYKETVFYFPKIHYQSVEKIKPRKITISNLIDIVGQQAFRTMVLSIVVGRKISYDKGIEKHLREFFEEINDELIKEGEKKGNPLNEIMIIIRHFLKKNAI
jgi:hypothetical protein